MTTVANHPAAPAPAPADAPLDALARHIDRRLAQLVRLTQRLKRAARPTGTLIGEADHGADQADAYAYANAMTRSVVDGLDFTARGLHHLWRNRRYYTLLKLVNMAAVNAQFALKTERVVGRPYSMKIESTNICNTKCQLCPTGLGLSGRPKGKMSFEQYAALVDALRWHLRDLDLSMWGDPLIVPDIYKMIRYAHDRGVWTYISSNLHAYKLGQVDQRWGKTHAQMLVESGLDLLTCSLHGASQATYEAYQPGKDFGDSVAKVREIVATREAMGSATPQVQLNFVVTRHNEHEVAEFEKLAEELGCKAVFSTASMNARFQDKDRNLVSLGLSDDLKKKKVKEHVAAWLPENGDYVLEPYRQMARDGVVPGAEWNGKKKYDCPWPWRQSVINWDGEVVTCCGNFDPREDLGNVFDPAPGEGPGSGPGRSAAGGTGDDVKPVRVRFGKVWNGRRYRLSRRAFKRKVDFQKEGIAEDELGCATCPGYML